MTTITLALRTTPPRREKKLTDEQNNGPRRETPATPAHFGKNQSPRRKEKARRLNARVRGCSTLTDRCAGRRVNIVGIPCGRPSERGKEEVIYILRCLFVCRRTRKRSESEINTPGREVELLEMERSERAIRARNLHVPRRRVRSGILSGLVRARTVRSL